MGYFFGDPQNFFLGIHKTFSSSLKPQVLGQISPWKRDIFNTFLTYSFYSTSRFIKPRIKPKVGPRGGKY